MDFGPGTYGLGFLAGVLTFLSPCVLPLIPLLVASAVSAHRLGAVALAAGLGLSFSAIGIFLAAAGASLGLDGDTLRGAAAVLMVVFGLVMLSRPLQARFGRLMSPLSSTGQRWLGKMRGDTWPGQFAIGLLLGVVWSPCVGPTLGAAATLASQGKHLAHIALLLGVFGAGASLPLILLGALSRTTFMKLRGRLGTIGTTGKALLGALFIAFGTLVLTGLDKVLEAALLSVSPMWLTAFTTSL